LSETPTDLKRFQPYVSVVVPVYNGRDTIAECIESLLAQDYPADRYEIIVVDNDSTDGTAEVVRTYPVQLLFEEKPSADAARNAGIRHARGEIVAFTDADCVADSHWLGQLVQHFVNEDVVGVAGKTAPFASESLVAEFLGSIIRHVNPDADEPLAMSGLNVAYRKQSLLDVGLFNDDLLGAGPGDIDLSWRIQVHTGGRAMYDPKAIVFHKYRNTVKALFKQCHRYGYSEMAFTTLHKGQSYHRRTPRYQLTYMLRQMWALMTYVRSALYRTITWPIHRRDRKYLLWPLLWLVAEGGNLTGKLQGLVATRWFRRNPYSNVSHVEQAQR
jgi:cellulose synthase/poly-beta-1,6-N-acetylglucosamine synthase-like glycosyltransferase